MPLGGIAPMTTPLGESFMFTLHGPMVIWKNEPCSIGLLRPQLRKIEGVADVNVLGGWHVPLK